MCCSVRRAPVQRTVVGKQTWSVSLGCICVSVRKATISLLEGRNVYQTREWYYQPPVARMATALPYRTHTATKIWVCKPLLLQIWSVGTWKFCFRPWFCKITLLGRHFDCHPSPYPQGHPMTSTLSKTRMHLSVNVKMFCTAGPIVVYNLCIYLPSRLQNDRCSSAITVSG